MTVGEYKYNFYTIKFDFYFPTVTNNKIRWRRKIKNSLNCILNECQKLTILFSSENTMKLFNQMNFNVKIAWLFRVKILWIVIYPTSRTISIKYFIPYKINVNVYLNVCVCVCLCMQNNDRYSWFYIHVYIEVFAAVYTKTIWFIFGIFFNENFKRYNKKVFLFEFS